MTEAVRLNKGVEMPERLLLEADRGRAALTGDLRRRILGPSIPAGAGFRAAIRMPYVIAGYVALRDHKRDEALEHFRAALRQYPMYWFIDPLETCLADALLELGRLDEAVAEYRRILRFNSNYPMARYRLGLALERKGMSREAHTELERFLTIWKNADPDIPELIDARRRYAQGSVLSAVKR